MRRGVRTIWFVILCAVGVSVSSAAWAVYPDRPIHWIVGFSAGGGADALARMIGLKLSEEWGQPVIIENQPGADGVIAGETVAHAAPDGYTIDLATTNHTVTPSLRTLAYDPINSFAPVTMMGESVDVLVVAPSLPVNSVAELITYAKAHPGALNFGSTGPGGSPYLEMLLLMDETGTRMVNVTYAGVAPSLVGLLSGEVKLMFGSLPTVVGQVKAGKLRAIAVSSKTRVPALPDVPTMQEAANLSFFDGTTSTWYGVLAPAGTPKDIVDKLSQAIGAILKRPDVQQVLAPQGFVTVADTPEEFGAFIKKDIQRWAAVLKAVAVK